MNRAERRAWGRGRKGCSHEWVWRHPTNRWMGVICAHCQRIEDQTVREKAAREGAKA